MILIDYTRRLLPKRSDVRGIDIIPPPFLIKCTRGSKKIESGRHGHGKRKGKVC